MFLKQVPPPHIRLFRRECICVMDGKDFNDLLEFTNSKQRTKLKALRDFEEAKGCLWQCIAYQEPNLDAITALMNLLIKKRKQLDHRVLEQLQLKGLKTHEYYIKILNDEDRFKLDRICSVLEPDVIIEYLQQRNCRDYDDLIERVAEFLQERMIDEAACELIRSLPYCSDGVDSSLNIGDWYYDFLEACLTHGYTKVLLPYIDPDYKIDLEHYRASREAENKKHIVFDDEIIDPNENPTEPRRQAEFKEFRVISTDIMYQAAECHLRPYQNELVAHAKKGRNTIICAPTGCGKTLVATDIILNHLRSFRADGKVSRALMVVPTIPLVEQQTIEFLRYMAGEFWVDGFSGAESLTNRIGNFLASDVCVVTPQVVINMLNSILKTDKLYFTDITLIVFDECHNCNEEHPYKILMDMLEKSETTNKPQIIGLTASLGVGQTSWDINACREHMLKMCSHLMADSISTVRHQIENLKCHVMPPVDVVIRARRPANDEFNQIIKETMLKIQQKMMPKLEKVVEKQLVIIKKEEIIFPDHQYSSRYQSVVGSLRKSLQRLSDPAMRLILVRSIDHLAHYFHAISISDLLPNKFALMYLDSKMSLYQHTSNNEDDINNFLLSTYDTIRKRLCQLCKKKLEETKEILQKLYSILNNQYSKKPESRTLVFVPTRACAQRLSEHLNDYLAKCKNFPIFYGKTNNAGYMTSTNQSAGASGQSNEMQRMMREKFERGELKILVVTSVADEGINIMECNLIIKYNTVGSERTLIQRRGRARAKDSKAILLALDGSVEFQEFDNMKKETMMIACINDLQAHRDEVLQKMILQKTEQLKQLRLQKQQTLQEQYDRLSSRKYLLKCRVCSTKICESMDVRCVATSLYVCCDPEVWLRSENKLINRPSKNGLTTKCARWLCKQCQEEWGIVVKYSSVFLPMLTVKALIIERIDTHEQMPSAKIKTWAQIQREYFNVDQISSKNIKDMLHALAKKSTKEQYSMEQQEKIADQLAVEKQTEKKVKQKILLDE